MTPTEIQVVEAWKKAAADLGIGFTAPFIMTTPDGKRFEYLGLVHHFGRRLGTIISVFDEPSSRVGLPVSDDYFRSELGRGYVRYDRQQFINTLDDWQFFASEAERPSWYSGTSWN